ncbi:MAG: RNA 2',3'-cyclic phosphodiesterase [Acidobacteria bacterium]|nr:RNA 2',3'-cyclic phosphodiesterase [Acidobacteriota bacterium]
MRLFVALDMDAEIRERIARFLEGVRGFAPDVRWAQAESLHITLKFIGEMDAERLDEVRAALAHVRSQATEIRFRGTGFFPTAKSARVFWVGVEAGAKLATLVRAVEDALEGLGVEREPRAFSPHLTLARTGSGRPSHAPEDRANPTFRRLQEKLAALPQPDFGVMTPQEFFLYQSKLSPKGALYTKLASFELG